MPTPSTAAIVLVPLDPHEVVDFVIPCGPLLELEDSEQVDSYVLTLSAEAVALGLEIMAGGGRDDALQPNGQDIKVWFTVDALFQENAAYDPDDGTDLAFEVTVVTNATPSRTRQRTCVLKVVQQ